MTEQCSRCQVALLGAGGVGKSSILKRYLYGKYSEVYSETVEETYLQPYNVNGRHQYISFLDTAGNIQFPAMRKIYTSKANGFILVYSVTSAKSFEEMKKRWEEIKSTRKNVLNIPCVIIGNYVDLENGREIESFDALTWAYSESLGGCLMEVSAKENSGIKDAFDILLEQFGNTRAEQSGPFRIRATSLNRKEAEVYGIKQQLRLKKQLFMKSQQISVDQVTPSNKCYRDSMFTNYKESNIYRIVSPHQKIYQRDACLKNSNSDQNTEAHRSPSRSIVQHYTKSRNSLAEMSEPSTSCRQNKAQDTKPSDEISMNKQDKENVPNSNKNNVNLKFFIIDVLFKKLQVLRNKTRFS